MRRSRSLWIVPAAMLYSATAFSQQSGPSEASVIKRLDSFYRFYITENAGIPNQKKLAATMKKYCTAAFLKKMKSPDIDADPLVDAQDFDRSWLSSLQVTGAGKNTYSVCFRDSYTQKPHCVKVSVKLENNLWKINNVQGN